MEKPARRIRLAYVIAQEVRWAAFEWICREVDREVFDLSFIVMSTGRSSTASYLESMKAPVYHLRFPGKRALPRAVREIYRYCRERKIDVVHTHFMNACLAGLPGALLAGVRVRIHTRHHAGPLPWFHRRPWERSYDLLNNLFSSHIVAPSREAQRALVSRDRVPRRKVTCIHHGFDLEAFRQVDDERVASLRRKLSVEDRFPILGVVARYERIKGIQHVIPAFRRLRGQYPAACLVLANARGRDRGLVAKELATLDPGSYREIPFEEDVFALYKLFDVVAHVPIAAPMEGFGQVYVEALAAGVPGVFTAAGVAGELLRHRHNAYVVEYGDSEQIYRGLSAILKDPELRDSLVGHGLQDVAERFSLRQMVRTLEDLYVAELSPTLRRNHGQSSRPDVDNSPR